MAITSNSPPVEGTQITLVDDVPAMTKPMPSQTLVFERDLSDQILMLAAKPKSDWIGENYARLTRLFKQKQSESEQSGKPLVIVSGYFNLKKSVNFATVVRAAREAGVNTAIVEHDAKLNRGWQSNILEANGMQIITATNNGQPDSDLIAENSYIRSAVAKQSGPVLVVVHASKLKGLASQSGGHSTMAASLKLHNDRTVALINIDPAAVQEYQHEFSAELKLNRVLAESYKFLATPNASRNGVMDLISTGPRAPTGRQFEVWHTALNERLDGVNIDQQVNEGNAVNKISFRTLADLPETTIKQLKQRLGSGWVTQRRWVLPQLTDNGLNALARLANAPSGDPVSNWVEVLRDLEDSQLRVVAEFIGADYVQEDTVERLGLSRHSVRLLAQQLQGLADVLGVPYDSNGVDSVTGKTITPETSSMHAMQDVLQRALFTPEQRDRLDQLQQLYPELELQHGDAFELASISDEGYSSLQRLTDAGWQDELSMLDALQLRTLAEFTGADYGQADTAGLIGLSRNSGRALAARLQKIAEVLGITYGSKVVDSTPSRSLALAADAMHAVQDTLQRTLFSSEQHERLAQIQQLLPDFEIGYTDAEELSNITDEGYLALEELVNDGVWRGHSWDEWFQGGHGNQLTARQLRTVAEFAGADYVVAKMHNRLGLVADANAQFVGIASALNIEYTNPASTATANTQARTAVRATLQDSLISNSEQKRLDKVQRLLPGLKLQAKDAAELISISKQGLESLQQLAGNSQWQPWLEQLNGRQIRTVVEFLAADYIQPDTAERVGFKRSHINPLAERFQGVADALGIAYNSSGVDPVTSKPMNPSTSAMHAVKDSLQRALLEPEQHNRLLQVQQLLPTLVLQFGDAMELASISDLGYQGLQGLMGAGWGARLTALDAPLLRTAAEFMAENYNVKKTNSKLKTKSAVQGRLPLIANALNIPFEKGDTTYRTRVNAALAVQLAFENPASFIDAPDLGEFISGVSPVGLGEAPDGPDLNSNSGSSAQQNWPTTVDQVGGSSSHALNPNVTQNPNGIVDQGAGTQAGHDGIGNNNSGSITAVAAPDENPFGNTVIPDSVIYPGSLENLTVPGSIPAPLRLPVDPDLQPAPTGAGVSETPDITFTPEGESGGGVTIGDLGNKDKVRERLQELDQIFGEGWRQGLLVPGFPPQTNEAPDRLPGFGEGLPKPTLDDYNTGWGFPDTQIEIDNTEVFPGRDEELENTLRPNGPAGPGFEFPGSVYDPDKTPESSIPSRAEPSIISSAPEDSSTPGSVAIPAALSAAIEAVPALQQLTTAQFLQLSSDDQSKLVERAIEYRNIPAHVQANTSLYQYADSGQTSDAQRIQLQSEQLLQSAQQASQKASEAGQILNQSRIEQLKASIALIQQRTQEIEQYNQRLQQQTDQQQAVTNAPPPSLALPGSAYTLSRPQATPSTAIEASPSAVVTPSTPAAGIKPLAAPIPRYMVVPGQGGNPTLIENFPNGRTQVVPFPLNANTPLTTQQEGTGYWVNVPDPSQIAGKLFLETLFFYGGLKMLNSGGPVQIPGSQGTPQGAPFPAPAF